MNKAQALAGMDAAGLPAPKVIPVKLRSGDMAFDLFCGPSDARKTVRLPSSASPDQVADAIALLKDQCSPSP